VKGAASRDIGRWGQPINGVDRLERLGVDPVPTDAASPDLRENRAAQERDPERAIIDRREASLIEMGKGFCFVARQKRLTHEGDHSYVDLVF
jgi:hypothetical protein